MSNHPHSLTIGQPQLKCRRQRWCGDGSFQLLPLTMSIGGALFCLFVALWVVGIDVVFPLSLFLSASLGFLFASVLVHNAHLCFGAQIVLAQLLNLLPSADDSVSKGQTADEQQKNGGDEEKKGQRHFATLKGGGHANSNYIVPPWERVELDARLNHELEELFETLLESYVSSWYTGLISTDTAFLLEVRHLIRHSSAKLINRLSSVDLRSLLINELFPLVLAHIERICRLTNAIFGHENHQEIAQLPVSLIEFKVFDQWSDDVHWAMRSEANRDAYLRMVADLLIRQFVDDIRIGGCFVDEEHAKIVNRNGEGTDSCAGAGGDAAAMPQATSKWSCHSSRHFLRELLFSSVLLPTLDALSDPDSLNRLMLNALTISSSNSGDCNEYLTTIADGVSDGEGTHRETTPRNQQAQPSFLSRFVEPYYTNTPDSLLGLKLNDLVENPYLTKLFEMYLRDLSGPTHLLDCFVQARDIHMRIQMLNSAKFGENCENDKRLEQEVGEVCLDSWQLFSTFVHSNGPNRIPFNEQIEKEFLTVFESFKSKNYTGKNNLNANDERIVDQQQHQQQQRNAKELKPLEKVIEAIYQQVYHDLQYNYVIPFWQSENYLGYLCGAPPDVDELIGGSSSDDGTLSARKMPTKMPEGSFSLAQFRKKLFNFITPSKEAAPSSSASSSSLFHQWSVSSSNVVDEFGTFATAVDNDLEEDGSAMAMADLGRDMAKWGVSIDGVTQRRADDQQTFYYIYSLSVERNDLPEECYTTPTTTTANKTAQSRQLCPLLTRAEEVDEEDFDDVTNLGGEKEEEEEELPKVWTVGHRCEEFFALEDRLREYLAITNGGNNNNNSSTFRLVNGNALPDRKTTLQLLHNGRNNRALLETYRIHFERFLQQLLQQPNMKRSDLLYIFLTSEENSTGLFELATGSGANGGWRSAGGGSGTTNFLPDLNPIRAMRKVGGKERGQNLKPFILNLLANTLAPPTVCSNATTTTMVQKQRSSEQNIHRSVDTMSVKSETATARSFDGGEGKSAVSSVCSTNKSKNCTAPAHIPREKQLPDDSHNGQQQQRHSVEIGAAMPWTGNFYDFFLFFSLHFGLIVRFPFWVESLLCSLRTFVGFLFSTFLRRKTAQILDDNLLNVEMAIYLVRSLHELILFQNVPSSLSATPSQNSAPLGKPSAADEQKMQQRRRKAMMALAGKQQTQAMAAEKLPAGTISEQERKLRAELALHCVEKWVERTLPISPFLRWAFGRFASAVSSAFPFCPSTDATDDETDQTVEGEENQMTDNHQQKEGDAKDGTSEGQRAASVRLLFQCFQMPTLNRQLAFVLLDKLLQNIVVERPDNWQKA
ncbi:hypothetical protein niasHT_020523 [Heterodera trifolii]|uniref:Sorting nexin-14 n=1 Tax=Heterodera trifolii TaxID=157864 RepID=A0ABD2J9L6_9BILA